MTDLEITKLCAEATRDFFLRYEPDMMGGCVWDWSKLKEYAPLHDDAQAMALVKKFQLDIEPCFNHAEGEWAASTWTTEGSRANRRTAPDLNRAICECVAKMQRGN